jgi:hypothetical protein
MRPRSSLICLVAALLALGTGAATALGQEAVPPWGRALDVDLNPGAEPLAIDGPPVGVEGAAPAAGGFYARAEYLLWWTKAGDVPALVTTGPTSAPLPGARGDAQTRILYGGTIDFNERHGARFTAGVPLGAGDWGAEASYFFLDARRIGPTFSSPGSPVLARPIFNALTGREDSSLTTFPGLLKGSVTVRNAGFLQGAEANATYTTRRDGENRVALLAGFRYLNLAEELRVQEDTQVALGAPAFAGSRLRVADRFAAANDFFGGQVGVTSQLYYKRFRLDLLAKLAVGNVHERVRVNGRTIADAAPALDASAGLLALGSNSGQRSRDGFAVVPEFGANLGLRLTDHCTIFAGYTFLYWSRVARPGDQVDRVVNPNLVPTSTTFGAPGTPARPAPLLNDTDFWAQGLNLGLEFRY